MFQASVKAQPAPALAGDFASSNPRSTAIAGPGQFVVPSGGLTVGNFVFINPADNTVHAAYVSGYEIGFVGRRQDGLITTFLAESTYALQAGFALTLFSGGDFWAKFAVAAPTPGVAVYASTTDGTPQVASSGGVLTGWTLRSIAGTGELAKMSTYNG
jgi:hypothetical protein